MPPTHSRLPPGRPLGRRERWLLVAVVVGVGEGILGHYGFAMSDGALMMLLGAIVAFVGGETVRPTGMTKAPPEE